MPTTRAALLPDPAWPSHVRQDHALSQGEVRRLKLGPGDTVLVRHGALWLTREGDAVDHLLRPGRGHVAAHAQDVVVEAMGTQPCHFEQHRLALSGRWWALGWGLWLRGAAAQCGRKGLKRRSSPKVLSGP